MSYKKRLFIFFGVVGVTTALLVAIFVLRVKLGSYKVDTQKIQNEVREFYQQ